MSYNFGQSYSTKEWDAARGSTDLDAVMFGIEDDALLPEFGCGTDGVNTFTLHINTSSTVDGSTYTRDSAWRKAYRFLNRFDLGTINMDRKLNGKETQSTYMVSRSFANIVNSFEVPIDHRPPCRFPLNNSSNATGSRPYIEMIYSMTRISGNAGTVDDTTSVEWSIGSTGLRLIENSTPESIEFTLSKQGTQVIKIDTSTSIIPAYSGEILSFQDAGYMENMQGGGVKIFIDITQTDEVLRWDSDDDPNRNPHESWLNTFSSIQLKNVTRKDSSNILFKKSKLAVVSKDKDNYVVSFENNDEEIPMTNWLNGDIIRTEFKRKKTIVFDDNNAPWEGAVYENIRYRRLADEFEDDPWIQAAPPTPTGACCTNGICEIKTEAACTGEYFGDDTTECGNCGQQSANILPFTTTLNGTLESGTITINYPAGFDSDGIKFEVFVEKDPTPPS